MNDKEHANHPGVHQVNNGKTPVSGPEAGTEKKNSETSSAAKEASRTDDTIV
jgi:hypothetical protein